MLTRSRVVLLALVAILAATVGRSQAPDSSDLPTSCLSDYINGLVQQDQNPPAAQEGNLLTNNANYEGNDYAAIYKDAIGGCAASALNMLNRKLNFTVTYADTCPSPCVPGTVLDPPRN